MSIKQQIIASLESAVTELGIEVGDIELTHPQNASQGDYATNVAMVLFSNQESRIKNQEWKSPRDLAQAIVNKLMIHDSEFMILEKVEVAGPGFINFYLTQNYYLEELGNLLNDNEKPLKTSFSGQKVMVEFTDPNPFKEFHIGHLYSNTVGEAISRLIEAGGAEVMRANYQGDVGLHVAKAIWGMQANLKTENLKLTEIEQRTVEERAQWLGDAYALGATAYEESDSVKQDIIAINKSVYTVILASEARPESPQNSDERSWTSQDDVSIAYLYNQGRKWSLEYFESIYRRLGTKFAYYYFESAAGPIGLALVKEYLDKGVFSESEGAVVFKGEDHGLHTRVFINSLGLPTYEAKELGLATKKYADYPFDLSISITGNEINEYFKVLLKVLSLIKPEIAEKTKHISHGMVRLPEGKMSSRTGNVLTGEWLLNEAKGRLKSAYPDMEPETLEMVTVGAIKWALLRSGVGKDISFNIDESISFEGDSGPYIQYTFARTQSVLAKSKEHNPKVDTETSFWEATTSPESLSGEELALLKLLVRFDEVVTEAAEHFSPNTITNYLFDLAQAFNLFYQKQRILDPLPVIPAKEGIQENGSPIGVGDDTPKVQNDNVRNFRLAITQATGKTLKKGLYLLGIKAPEKM